MISLSSTHYTLARRLLPRFEAWLGSRAAPRVLGRSAYVVLGVVGYAAALSLVVALAIDVRIQPAAILLLGIVPPVTLLTTVVFASAAFRYRRLVFYDRAIAAVAGTAAGFAVIGAPVAVGVDLATIGLGVFLVFGRIGCFRVGCCHGRPARFGIRYTAAHRSAGFSTDLIGVKLFPIQLVDATASLIAVALAVALQLQSHDPGEPAAAFAGTYSVCRLFIEIGRGDPARRYAVGLSVPQWTSVGIVVFAAGCVHTWWSLAAVAVAVVVAIVLIGRNIAKGSIAP